MKSDYITRAQKFIKTFYRYMEESNCFVNRRNYDNYNDAVEKYNNSHSRTHICLANGVARVAFIHSDYVIKYDYRLNSFAGNSENEYKAWLFAQKEGFGYLFAEVTPFEYNGKVFYIMPRVNNVGYYGRDDFYDSLTVGERNFINDYIEDIHDGNFGKKNGRFVCIDYAWNYV